LHRTSDDELVDEDSPRKKQRKLFEDVDARNLREQDRLRVAEQEERRKNLQKKLASSDQHGVLNEGQIIVNDAKADDQGYIYVHPHISSRIKKHQIDGIRFMWNQIVGDEKVMQGCLLAHTMGLGKTMQV
jgi:SNF2 family DNA or RNA helicase